MSDFAPIFTEPQASATYLRAGMANWAALEGGDDQPALGEALRDPLSSEHLGVLAGLGTSLSVVGDDGNPLAPGMEVLWEKVSALGSFGAVKDKLSEPVAAKNFEALLSACQYLLAIQTSPEVEKFVAEAEKVVLDACRFLDGIETLPTHEQFLRKIAARDPRMPRTQVFTTNYDLCFEFAAANAGFTLIDGFRLDKPRRFNGASLDVDVVRREPGGEVTFEPNVALFLKLHGSIDWERHDGHVLKSDNPASPAMIYPRESKFQLAFQNPYLECMSRFQAMLRRSRTTLLVIGVGFNDEHLAAPIRSALESNTGINVVVVDPALESADSKTVKLLRNLIRGGDKRVTLVASGFGDFVRHLPDPHGESDELLHQQRFVTAARESGLDG